YGHKIHPCLAVIKIFQPRMLSSGIFHATPASLQSPTVPQRPLFPTSPAVLPWRLSSGTSPDIQLFFYIVQIDGEHPGHALLLRRRKVRSAPDALTGIGRSISLLLLSPPDPLRWARAGAPHAGAGRIFFIGYS